MTDPDSVQAKKNASAAGAADNFGAGIDGDGPSRADTAVDPSDAPDPAPAPQDSDRS